MSFEKTPPCRSRARSSWTVVAFGIAVALAIGSPFGFASSAPSRIGVLELDPSKTLVEFQLGGSLHNTHGHFKLRSGSLKADSATGNAEGAIVVDATSGDSGDSMRDNRMKDSVLETKLYPLITFTPRHIDGHLDPRGSFKASLQGLLQLHGTEHRITIEAQGTLIDDELIATAHFQIPYVKWGLKDPSVLFLTVAKDVGIDIATAGRIRWLSGEKPSSH